MSDRQAETALTHFKNAFVQTEAVLSINPNSKEVAKRQVDATAAIFRSLEKQTDPIYGDHGTAHGLIERMDQRLTAIAKGTPDGELYWQATQLRKRLVEIDRGIGLRADSYGIDVGPRTPLPAVAEVARPTMPPPYAPPPAEYYPSPSYALPPAPPGVSYYAPYAPPPDVYEAPPTYGRVPAMPLEPFGRMPFAPAPYADPGIPLASCDAVREENASRPGPPTPVIPSGPRRNCR